MHTPKCLFLVNYRLHNYASVLQNKLESDKVSSAPGDAML